MTTLSPVVANVLARLEHVHQNGRGWSARCPAHDDGRASLTVSQGQDDRVLLHCHAGCTLDQIIAVIGLELRDLFPPRPNGQPATSTAPPSRRIVATYGYRDESGTLLFEAVRFAPKSFAQRQPDGHGGWRWDIIGIRRVLYRLPELLAADPAEPVYVTEGERDADSLAALGLVATCNPMGAGNWQHAYSLSLAGRHVAIIPDNDVPGRAHAQAVATSLYGVAASVKVVELPGLADKGDVSDFLNMGGTLDELRRLAQAAPEWAPPKGRQAPSIGGLGALSKTWRSKAVCLAGIQPERVRWLWPGRIPFGKVSILDGDPGLGKSVLTLDLAARVSTGRAMPDGTASDLAGPGGVVIMSVEDGLADTVVPRLIAAGADLSRIVAITTLQGADGTERSPGIPEDLPTIQREIEAAGARLLIIDPVMAFLSGGTDSHRDQDVRRALAPLSRLASDTGIAVTCVRHLNKAAGGNPIYRGGGSIGIIGAARAGLLVARDPDDDTRRVLAVTKCNLSAPAPALAYRLEPASDSIRVTWEGVTMHTAGALLAVPADAAERSAVDDAVAFLTDALRSGAVDVRRVKTEARAAAISERTLDRAKARAGVRARKQGFGQSGSWVWELPPKGATGDGVGDGVGDGALRLSTRQLSSSPNDSLGSQATTTPVAAERPALERQGRQVYRAGNLRDGVVSDFIPSAHWQQVPDGTVLPAGGIYRADLASGLNYARWPDVAAAGDGVTDQDRAAVLDLGESRGWPAVPLGPGSTLSAGQSAWQVFVAAATGDRLTELVEHFESLEVPA